jgi:hypothetical protein
MSAALQRVNLNLPPEDRQRLRSLAKAARTPEAVYARQLLVEALGRAERSAFRRKLDESRTPERKARDRTIAEALERLRG